MGRLLRWRWLLALAIVAWLGALVLHERRPRASPPEAKPMRLGAAPSPLPRLAPWSFDAERGPLRAAAASGTIEVCGHGVLAADSERLRRLADEGQRHADTTVERVLAQMRSSADERVRAAGLRASLAMASMQDHRRLAEEMIAAPDAPECAGSDCGASGPASVEAGAALRLAAEQIRERVHAEGTPLLAELARLALHTRDPAVYADAYAACEGARAESACAAIDARGWVALEPDNAIAWMELTAAAPPPGDAALEGEVLYRIGEARRSDLRFGALAGLALAQLGAAPDAMEAAEVATALLGIDAARSFPAARALLGACSEQRLADANRRQACVRAADRLSELGSTLFEVTIARGIGRRVWPAERLRQEEARGHELQGALNEGLLPPERELSCDGLQQLVLRARDLARVGETGLARERLERRRADDASLVRQARP